MEHQDEADLAGLVARRAGDPVDVAHHLIGVTRPVLSSHQEVREKESEGEREREIEVCVCVCRKRGRELHGRRWHSRFRDRLMQPITKT